ncbi:MAG: DUF4381 family protein [Candidatus Babeliales bacterium]
MAYDPKNLIVYDDLYDLWAASWWQQRWFWVLIGIMATLIAFGLFFLIKKFKQSKKTNQDPWQEALALLQMIDPEGFKDRLAHKDFYAQVTLILKNYLGARYDLALASKTDDEVIELVCSSSFPASLHDSLKEIFTGALFVKFANQDAAFQKMLQDLEASMKMVKVTMPSPPS